MNARVSHSLGLKFSLLLLVSLLLGEAAAAIQVAVTVDDLPAHSSMPSSGSRIEIARKMISVFRKHGVKEVYGFVNAKKLVDNPEGAEVLRLWRKAGFLFGNHTFSHAGLTESTVEGFKKEIDRNEPALRKFSEGSDWRYFRYPYLREGNTLSKRDAIREYLGSKGYRIAQVTIDFEDWSWNAPYARCADRGDSEKLGWLKKTYLDYASSTLKEAVRLAESLYHRPIKHVLLLHIGAFDAQMLDSLLESYKNQGVEFVTLGDALKDEIYAFDPKYVNSRSSDFLHQVLKSRRAKEIESSRAATESYPELELSRACL